MRDVMGHRPQQPRLTFERRDRWPTLPEPERCHCRELVGQLLRAVLEAEAARRSEDDREHSARTS